MIPAGSVESCSRSTAPLGAAIESGLRTVRSAPRSRAGAVASESRGVTLCPAGTRRAARSWLRGLSVGSWSASGCGGNGRADSAGARSAGRPSRGLASLVVLASPPLLGTLLVLASPPVRGTLPVLGALLLVGTPLFPRTLLLPGTPLLAEGDGANVSGCRMPGGETDTAGSLLSGERTDVSGE